MKIKRHILILLIVISTNIFPQGFMIDEGMPFPGGRIAELEKIKLIETLDLDEETMIKFFSRRNEHDKKHKSGIREKDSLLIELNNLLLDGSQSDYDSQIKKILKIEEKMLIERRDFIESLDDIFTSEDLAKYLVFEKEFRNELRKGLLKHGRRMRGKNPMLE